jgi:Domain of unknown function (DUF4386)
MFGTGFATFGALPRLLDASSAMQTSQNILAHQGLFSAAIISMLVNFVGDVLAAWGLYVLLRPVSAAWSMLVAWFRLVYTAAGLAAVLQLATAHRLLTQQSNLAALGQTARDAQVQVAVRAFQAQFDASLILFGLYLVMLGCLMWRSGYVPKWLGAVIVVCGLGWVATEVGPYLLPGVPLGFLFFTSFGELVLLVWLVGWGTRLDGRCTMPA